MRFITTLTLIVICGLSTTATAATRTTLESQMTSLSKQVEESLASDPRVKGQTVVLGEFRGEGEATGTNFGLRIEQTLKANLGTVLKEKGTFTLAGSYLYATSEDPATPDAKVLVVTAQIKNDRGKSLIEITVEVNDTDSILQVLGLTASIPDGPKVEFKERNEATKKAQTTPDFGTIGGTRVTAVNAAKLGMGILKKATFDGPTTPVEPESVAGQAFVSIGPGDYYEIELVNLEDIDVVASLTVDGLDVANTFATDKDSVGQPMNWPGYFIPAGTTVIIRGWLNTIDQSVHDNVFSFRVVELGQGAASALKARGGVGVITVQFREACAPEAKLSGRSFGETAKGEGLQERIEPKPVQIGENVLSTVSLRYNRPRE